MTRTSYRILFAGVLAVAVTTRLAFVLAAPAFGGDWDIYARVAENILRGCGVSLSDPAGAACVPHFGGNQLPGYPAFVAAVLALTGSETAIRLAQTALVVAASGWLMHALRRFSNNDALALGAGLVLALSPLQIAWPRFLVTEALALATVLWVLAELVLSLAERRLRILPLALALTAAIFIRLDGILLVVPVALVGFMVHRPREAVWRGALLAMLVALPLAAWTARNIAVDLPRLWPSPMTMPDNAPPPLGYVAWGRSWLAEEYQRPGWGFPVNRFAYRDITIDPRAYDSAAEQGRVEALLAELKRHAGQPFPPEIDRAFQRIAEERNARDPLRAWIFLPLRRAWSLWSNPFSSYGWPTELPPSTSDDDRLALAQGGFGGMLALALEHPWIALGKALTAGYKFALVILFAGAVALGIVSRLGAAGPLVWIATSYVAARTGFFAWTAGLESRYMVEAVPFMETAVLAVALVLVRQWVPARRPAPFSPSA